MAERSNLPLILLSPHKNIGICDFIYKSRIEIEAQKLNFSKAKKDLKWNPKINFKSGILKTLKWYKDNLHLFK